MAKQKSNSKPLISLFPVLSLSPLAQISVDVPLPAMPTLLPPLPTLPDPQIVVDLVDLVKPEISI